MASRLDLFLLSFLFCSKLCVLPVIGQTYDDVRRLFNDVMNSSVYNNDIRPLQNQALPVSVNMSFELVSIVAIDDITQTMTCNGFMVFEWTDERLQWDPAQYGGHDAIHPKVKDVWKPRVALMNTVGDRDIFEDDHAPLFTYYYGYSMWAPGGLFPTSCQLDLTKYPFDTQTCSIYMLSFIDDTQLQFFTAPNAEAGRSFYTENGEWTLKGSRAYTSKVTVAGARFSDVPSFVVEFTLARRPTFIVLNILLPVVLLSFLNILVFVIPGESGEKISYGVTCLMALSVLLSVTSSMLPQSSAHVPSVTLYLAALLGGSVLTVVVSVVIVYLKYLEQEEEKRLQARSKFVKAAKKLRIAQNAVAPLIKATKDKETLQENKTTSLMLPVISASDDVSSGFTKLPVYDGESHEAKSQHNKYSLVCRYIEIASFGVFLVAWVSVTVLFMAQIMN